MSYQDDHQTYLERLEELTKESERLQAAVKKHIKNIRRTRLQLETSSDGPGVAPANRSIP